MAEQAALVVDQQRDGKAERQAALLEIVEEGERVVAVVAQRLYAGLGKEFLRLHVVAGIDIDGDHLEFLSAQFLLQRVERRHFLAAWRAPCRPEVEENGLACTLRERHRLEIGRASCRERGGKWVVAAGIMMITETRLP